MIYLVNKITKEHRRYEDAIDWRDSDCRLVQADADGWVPHDGGVCPLPEGHLCDVRHRDGELCEEVPAGVAASPARNDAEFWSHNAIMPSGDIIAYRPVLDAKPEAPMPEQGTDATTPRRPFLYSGRLRERLGPFEVSPPAWDGDGLPPVGCECEYYDAIQKKWMPASIVAHHINGEEAIWSESLDGGDLFYGTHHDFRPIRSEEGKAVEEMLKSVGGRGAYTESLCRALYRAGYRKTGADA